jgi:hypothetical protein
MPNIVELPCRTESSLINAILRPVDASSRVHLVHGDLEALHVRGVVGRHEPRCGDRVPMTIGPVSVEPDPPDEPDPPVERIRRRRR